MRARVACAALALVTCALACAPQPAGEPRVVTLRMWALGREGEEVQKLIPGFERQNPGIHVIVQQVPWSAAHEKQLTAIVGNASPDISQLGNTWVPEFAALNALEPLDAYVTRDSAVDQRDFFPGIWATNVVDSVTYGMPWYVDTRLLFYRTDLLERAGYKTMPMTWSAWLEAMRKVKALDPSHYVLLMPLDEWAQPVIFGLQAGSPLLRDGGRYGAFTQPQFKNGFAFLMSLYRDSLAPAVTNTQVANLYQDFASGRIAMYITGPWNIEEFRKRLPPETQGHWATSVLPGPDSGGAGGVSIAGGSSLVIYRSSHHKAQAWKLISYLSQARQQTEFYRLTSDLPARMSAWNTRALSGDSKARVFYAQLEHVEPLPDVPEWEQIATRIAQAAEQAARGQRSSDAALKALDADVNQLLEKRRWVLAQNQARAARAKAAP